MPFLFRQTYCLKMLVKSFLHQDSKGARTTKLKGLLNLLSKLISGNGQLVAGVESRYAIWQFSPFLARSNQDLQVN